MSSAGEVNVGTHGPFDDAQTLTPTGVTTIDEKIDTLYGILSNLWFNLAHDGLAKKEIEDTARPDLLTRLDQKLQRCISTSGYIKDNLEKLSKDVGSS